MNTVADAFKHDAIYFGDREDWLIVLGRNRDSGAITNSNFETALKQLGGEGEHVAVENASHWACGWVEYLIVDPANEALVAQAEEIRDSLENYPVLDDEDVSRREYEDYLESWDSWGRRDYREGVAQDLRKHWDDSMCAPYTLDEIAEGVTDLPDDVVDKLVEKARQSVNWEYQAEGSGTTINIDGLVEETELDPVYEAVIANMEAAQRAVDIQKLGRWLDAPEAVIKVAVERGIDRVPAYLKLINEYGN
jgi:hypothetical protein